MHTHAHFLRILEATHWDQPYLYIHPVWADEATFQPAPSFLFDTPWHGLTDIAFRGTIDPHGNPPVFLLCSTLQFPDIREMESVTRQMQRTHRALADLAKAHPGEALSYGRRCVAWAEAFNMAGVIVDRSPGDDRCGAVRMSRTIAATVDRAIEDWAERHREDFGPVIEGRFTVGADARALV